MNKTTPIIIYAMCISMEWNETEREEEEEEGKK